MNRKHDWLQSITHKHIHNIMHVPNVWDLIEGLAQSFSKMVRQSFVFFKWKKTFLTGLVIFKAKITAVKWVVKRKNARRWGLTALPSVKTLSYYTMNRMRVIITRSTPQCILWYKTHVATSKIRHFDCVSIQYNPRSWHNFL